MDSSKVRFRASQVGKLMVGGTEFSEADQAYLQELYDRRDGKHLSKSGKPLGLTKTQQQEDHISKYEAKKAQGFQLGATAKAVVEQRFLEVQYGARQPVVTDEMLKGHMVESDSVRLLDQVLPVNEYRKLYTGKRRHNDFFDGICDIELSDVIEDMKSSWSLVTFFKTRQSTIPEDYYGQGQVYMDLFGKDKFRLCYVLVSTPDELLYKAERRLEYKFNSDESKDYQEAVEQLWSIHKVNHIPAQDRVKVFEFERNEEYLTELKKRVEYAREYYSTLRLNMK